MNNSDHRSKIRVAAVQLAVTGDVAANLTTCCRMLDLAAEVGPDVVVMPEFCNHLAWYRDQEHSYEVAVDLKGEFVEKIGQKAVEHGFAVMINCTVKRPNQQVTGSNIFFDADGVIIATSDKQVLMGNENNFLEKAAQNSAIISMPWGKAGMYSCMDGVIFETSRGLAVRGSQILFNSLNSFAKDEGDLHIPVRAAENKLFVVAANKVGPLVPPEMLNAVADRLKIDPGQLFGAGHSQIVGPDGTVLAKAPARGEAVIFADIDLREADHKLRPDGTDVMASRRPELYEVFRKKPEPRRKEAAAVELAAAVFQPQFRGPSAIDELTRWLPQAAANRVQLITLPELFFLNNGTVDSLDQAFRQSTEMIKEVSDTLAQLTGRMLVATTIITQRGPDIFHEGVLIDKTGIVFRQPQLHRSERHDWVTKVGHKINYFDADWGRVGVVVGNDAIYPETFRLMVIKDIEVAAVSTHILESWEGRLGLLERAAENRMNLLVGSPREAVCASMILATDPDFTLWTTWQNRPFDGNINTPIVTRAPAEAGGTMAKIYPAASANRTISQKTNVVEDRPWWLADALMN